MGDDGNGDRREVRGGNRYVLHRADEALEKQDPIVWVVEKLFPIGSVSLVVGQPGVGKTYALLDAAVCVATGKAWLERTTRQGSVLVIDEESGDRRFKQRLGQVLRGHDQGKGVPIDFTTLEKFNLRPARSNPNREPDDLQHVDELLQRTTPVLVVIDALADMMPGADENSVKDVHPVFRELRTMAEKRKTAIVVIHHATKDGKTYRGTSAMEAAVDLALMVKSSDKGGGVKGMRFISLKTRDTEAIDITTTLHFDPPEQPENGRVFLQLASRPTSGRPNVKKRLEKPSAAESDILEFLKYRQCGEIKEMGMEKYSRKQVTRALEKLEGARKVEQINPGHNPRKWKLADPQEPASPAPLASSD